MFSFLRNNTLSRAELSESEGHTLNVHYGDVLIKFGEILDVSRDVLPRIADDSLANRLSCQTLTDGDVIIADTAEDEAVGKCSELRGCGDARIVSGLHTMACRPLFEFAPGYLGYYLNSPAYHSQLLPLMQGIKVISVSKSAIEDTFVSFPSFAEQRAVGASLSELDSLITLHQRNNTINWSTLHAWEQRKLGELATFMRGERFTADDYVGEGGIPSVHYGEIHTRFGATAEEVFSHVREDLAGSLRYAKQGDVIVAATSENVEDVCTAMAWLGKEQVAIHDDCFTITSPLDARFLSCFFASEAFFRQKTSLAYGVKVMRVNSVALAGIDIGVPSPSEQRRIGSALVQLDNLITLHQRRSYTCHASPNGHYYCRALHP